MNFYKKYFLFKLLYYIYLKFNSFKIKNFDPKDSKKPYLKALKPLVENRSFQ